MREFDQQTTDEREEVLMRALSELRDRAARETLSDRSLSGALDELLSDFPLKVQIQTTTRCNGACRMCPYVETVRRDGFVHEEMPEELFRLVLHQLRGSGVRRLSLFLMNEPLLDRRLPSWLRLAREALPEVTLGLFSNGAKLSGPLARDLARAGLDELCVSVHGFDPELYERMMGGLSYRRLMRNLREVTELYRSGDLAGLRLKIITGDEPALRATVDQAPSWLRDQVLLKGFSNEREASGGAPAASQPEPAGLLCQRPFVKLYLLANGAAVLCNVDWQRTVVLGRVGAEGARRETLADIWRGPAYRSVRLAHLRQRLDALPICRGCDYPSARG